MISSTRFKYDKKEKCKKILTYLNRNQKQNKKELDKTKQKKLKIVLMFWGSTL